MMAAEVIQFAVSDQITASPVAPMEAAEEQGSPSPLSSLYSVSQHHHIAPPTGEKK